MELENKIKDVLLELRNARTSIQHLQGEEFSKALREIMERYNMRFDKTENKVIYSSELTIALKEKFDISIHFDTLNSLLLDLCPKLGMKTCELYRRKPPYDPDITHITDLMIQLF